MAPDQRTPVVGKDGPVKIERKITGKAARFRFTDAKLWRQMGVGGHRHTPAALGLIYVRTCRVRNGTR